MGQKPTVTGGDPDDHSSCSGWERCESSERTTRCPKGFRSL